MVRLVILSTIVVMSPFVWWYRLIFCLYLERQIDDGAKQHAAVPRADTAFNIHAAPQKLQSGFTTVCYAPAPLC